MTANDSLSRGQVVFQCGEGCVRVWAGVWGHGGQSHRGGEGLRERFVVR